MKYFIKKTIALVVILAVFAGCAVKEKSQITSEDDHSASQTGMQSVKIGVIQIVEHPSLDEIRQSFIKNIEQSAAQNNLKLTIEYKNAQNDISMVTTIARDFVDKKVDVIVAIATPSAQGAASVTGDIPIVFSAVTDPVEAGLVENISQPGGNITGVSDYIDIAKIFELSAELTPDIKSYGIIYNKGEINSQSVVKKAKAYLDSKGLNYTEKTADNAGDVQQAVRILLEENDALFVPIDNTMATAMTIIAQEAISAGKPVYVSADSMVKDGGLATVGVNYTELGRLTSEITMRIIKGENPGVIPVEIMSDAVPVVNELTANELGIDVSKYLV